MTTRIVIIDMQGNIMKEIETAGTITIPITDLINGNYTVQFFGDFGVLSKNLVIVR
jgi:hypothetical protein